MSRSFSVGPYYSQQDKDPFDIRIRAKLDGKTLDQNDPENWSPEKIRAAGEMFDRNDKNKQDLIQTGRNGDAFVAAHPEVLDSTKNGELFKHEMNRMFGECLHTVEHYEAAYQSLRASNLVQIDKAKDESRRRAADKQRYDAQKEPSIAQIPFDKMTPTQLQQLETMPLEELRRLGAVEAQRQMQLRGEEGGW